MNFLRKLDEAAGDVLWCLINWIGFILFVPLLAIVAFIDWVTRPRD